MSSSDKENRILLFDELNTNAALAMARHLGEMGYIVDVLVPKKHPVNYSRYCNERFEIDFPHENKETYIEKLLNCIRSNVYETIFVFEDHLMEVVYENIREVEKYTRLLLPKRIEYIDLAINKRKTFEHAQSIGIPIPKTFYPRDIGQVKSLKDAFKYPMIVKGERGTAGLHVRKVFSYPELVHAYHEIAELEKDTESLPMIQEHIRGKGYVCHALFSDSRPVSICIHEKVHEIPVVGGITSVGRTVNVEAIKEYAIKILSSLEWEGLVKLDFLYNEVTGEYNLIEIDPRISASIDICRVAGTFMIEKSLAVLNNHAVTPDLSFRDNILYTWSLPNEVLYIFAIPRSLIRFVTSLFQGDSFYDVYLGDVKPEFVKVKKTLSIIADNFFSPRLWMGRINL